MEKFARIGGVEYHYLDGHPLLGYLSPRIDDNIAVRRAQSTALVPQALNLIFQLGNRNFCFVMNS